MKVPFTTASTLQQCERALEVQYIKVDDRPERAAQNYLQLEDEPVPIKENYTGLKSAVKPISTNSNLNVLSISAVANIKQKLGKHRSL